MKKQVRNYKHLRVRKQVVGREDRPRVAVFRSSQHIYAQLIDDVKNITLASVSDLNLKGTKSEKALMVGEALAKKALDIKVKQIVFDRGGFIYHGRVMNVAEGLRKGGLEF